MKVSAQYAEDHFKEILATAARGEEIDIASEGQPAFRLHLVHPAEAKKRKGPIVLGAGAGELELPTDDEWKQMDEEIADLMLNGPLFPEDKH